MGKSWFDDYYTDPKLPHEFQVREQDSHFTGVLDAHGERIYRHPQPVGFVTDYRSVKPRTRGKRRRD